MEDRDVEEKIMAYLRGDPYVWSDGKRLHIWSNSPKDGDRISGVSVSEDEFLQISIEKVRRCLKTAPIDLQRVLERVNEITAKNVKDK